MAQEVLGLKQVDIVNDSKNKQAKTNKKNLTKTEITPELSENALTVIEKRYLLKDRNNKPIETPQEMFHRVSRYITKADLLYNATKEEVEKNEQDFYQIMAKLEFLPGSPTFSGSGTRLGQLSSCFVLPVEDNMQSILKTQMDMGLVQKSGGGTGFSFSRIRPKNDLVGSTGGIASGPVGFMQMYNDTTDMIKQGGIRRGANMGILRIDHPDIIEFIEYKNKEGTLTTFNISVGITDKFMKAVKEDKDYDLINPNTNKKVQTLKAREIFDKIVDGAWNNGEPGIVFLDAINKTNPTPQLGEIEATNPCGEQPLLPYESCNLGSINLGKMVKDTGKAVEIDWEKLDRVTSLATHFLDNVIDMNQFPIAEIEEMTKSTRKIGLGIMGFADLLFQLEVSYDSDEAIDIAEKLMKRISDASHQTSQKLAQKKGNFPAFEGSMWDKKDNKFMRNATTTTIAPTGTLSIFASATSGIEPIFALVYTKTVMDGTALVEVNRYFKRALTNAGIYSDDLIKKVSKSGSIQDFDEIPDKIKKIFVTCRDISPEWHVKMQAAFQKHTDNAISKTINFPNSATISDVKQAYLLSFDLGCKGITVYRDGSRNVQILTTGMDSKKKEDQIPEQTIVATGAKITPRERPDVIRGYTYRLKTAYGKLFITINDDENGQPFEVFSHLGKAGGFFAAKAEAICRLISLSLRSGVDPEEIIDQLKGIRGPTPTWSDDGKMILSLPDGIAQVLEKHLSKAQESLNLEFKTAEQTKITANDEVIANSNLQFSNGFSKPVKVKSLADLGEAPACPECSSMLELSEGCMKCLACGYSKCA
ncbi:MAG: Ribonucleoside-diphosphate reductase [Berkelbacteria bacterium GW2011_GWB1_38_5]|uniref:Vitamin B12-dependent ribonucleotide reductase n=1 Tax=Berkelbacteria bacterium GW2011_GWB1_38_5 TaxID=1618336 RepID=A0A0G0K618_9BACT|nr:MAG: Ribonucleoside-diphosphate reductase [Berkelbacteria bacterium GW2011_GWB1_38_5]